jgi:hypothetical protein
VLRLSALDHPNVQQRREVVPGAVSHGQIDALVRSGCTDQGPYPGTPVESGDFLYSLPPTIDSPDPAPRGDGIPGHAHGHPRVYRPGPVAEVSVLGRTASASPTGLFHSEAISAAFARFQETVAPQGPPARVGCDPARFGTDNSTAVPAWGESAEALLRAYSEAQESGQAAIAELLATRRARVGHIVILGRGDGPTVAQELAQRWPGIPLTVDDGSVGASVIDHATRVLGAQVEAVTFGGVAPPPPPGLPYCENRRTWLYVLSARLVDLGLADVGPDELLREELLAHRLEPRSMSIKIGETRRRVSSVLLASKDSVKALIGRSPDRADAFVLSLVEAMGFGGAAAVDPGQIGRNGLRLRADYGQRRRGLF